MKTFTMTLIGVLVLIDLMSSNAQATQKKIRTFEITKVEDAKDGEFIPKFFTLLL